MPEKRIKLMKWFLAQAGIYLYYASQLVDIPLQIVCDLFEKS